MGSNPACVLVAIVETASGQHATHRLGEPPKQPSIEKAVYVAIRNLNVRTISFHRKMPQVLIDETTKTLDETAYWDS
jgi:hypothetical protein